MARVEYGRETAAVRKGLDNADVAVCQLCHRGKTSVSVLFGMACRSRRHNLAVPEYEYCSVQEVSDASQARIAGTYTTGQPPFHMYNWDTDRCRRLTFVIDDQPGRLVVQRTDRYVHQPPSLPFVLPLLILTYLHHSHPLHLRPNLQSVCRDQSYTS